MVSLAGSTPAYALFFLELTGDYNIEYDRNYQRNEKLYDRTD